MTISIPNLKILKYYSTPSGTAACTQGIRGGGCATSDVRAGADSNYSSSHRKPEPTSRISDDENAM